MSRPNPFKLDDAHWDLIMTFVGLKAAEDGVVEVNDRIGLMQQYWLLISDLRALTREVEAIELERIEGALVDTKQRVIDQEQEIADRKAGNPPPRRTVTTETPEEPVGPDVAASRVDPPEPEEGRGDE